MSDIIEDLKSPYTQDQSRRVALEWYAAEEIRVLRDEIEELNGYAEELEDVRKSLLLKVDQLKSALVDCRADDRTCMEYLQAVRDIVGGDHFLDMIQRVRSQKAEIEAAREWLRVHAEIDKAKSAEIKKLWEAITEANEAMRDGSDSTAWAILVAAITGKE